MTDCRGGKKEKKPRRAGISSRSDSKGTRTKIPLRAVTSLAKTVALDTTGKQKSGNYIV